MTTTSVWTGPDALTDLVRPIEGLHPHPDNARNGDIDAISESLAEHGQYAPVVYQASTGYIVKGNHVYAAALALGWDSIAATPVQVDDDTALRILLVDNRTSDLGRYDERGLADLLGALEGDLRGTGYDDNSLNRLLADLARAEAKALDPGATRGLGDTPVISYLLVFDTEAEQDRWNAFLRWLRVHVDGDTIAERILTFVDAVQTPTPE